MHTLIPMRSKRFMFFHHAKLFITFSLIGKSKKLTEN